MMRYIAFIFALCALAFAAPRPTQDDFNACYEKNFPSIVNVGGNLGVTLSPNLVAAPKTGEMPIRNYIKFDPFLGLYLVASDTKLEPVRMSDDNKTKKSDWVSVTTDINATSYGHVKALGERLGELDRLTFDINGTGALLGVCCNLRGIAVGGDKFVPNRYLRHFIAYPDVYYGDVGATFEAINGKFYVKTVDQLGRGKALMAGDEIVSVNDEKFDSLRELNERILFAKKGEILNFEILRDGITEKFEIPVSSPAPGKDDEISSSAPSVSSSMSSGVEPKRDVRITNSSRDLFKSQGITLDDKLVVKKIDEDSKAAKFGVKVGDKLLQVNQEAVKNYKDALNLTSREDGEYVLLFRRGGFDFFYKAR